MLTLLKKDEIYSKYSSYKMKGKNILKETKREDGSV